VKVLRFGLLGKTDLRRKGISYKDLNFSTDGGSRTVDDENRR